MSPDNRHLAQLFGVIQPDGDASRAEKRTRKAKSLKQAINWGHQAMLDGDTEVAIRHFELGVELSGGKELQPVLLLAEALEMAGKEDEAERILADAKVRFRDDVEPKIELSDVYRRSARFRDSIDELERAIAQEPSNPLYHMKLAGLCRDSKLYQYALRAAERAALCAPDQAFFHFWLGDLLIEMKRFDEAIEPLRNALNLSPGDDLYLLRASVALFGSGRQLEAKKAVQMAMDLVPDNGLYPLVLDLYRKRTGEPPLQTASEVDRYDSDLLNRIEQELGAEGDPDSASRR